MATLVASYAGQSGATLYVGRYSEAEVPAWLTAPAGQWGQIPDTPAPSWLGDYSTAALRDDETGVELFAALGGGHGGNTTDNSVQTLQLDTATPAWLTRRSASSTAGSSLNGSQAYYTSDNRPIPRHTYQAVHWLPEIASYVVGGCFWGTGSGATGDFAYMDVFVPAGSAGDWTIPTPYASTPGAPGALNRQLLAVRDPATGNLYATVNDSSSRIWRWNPLTNVWTGTVQSGAASLGAGATAFDTRRGNVYLLANQSWVVASGTIVSTQLDVTTAAKTAITFNSSPAFTDFSASVGQWTYPAIVYAEGRDAYFFMGGRQGSLTSADATKVYHVTPNSGTAWDMQLIAGAGGATPPALGDAGMQTKLKYIPRWDVLLKVVGGQSVYYMRLPFSSALSVRSGATAGTLPYTATVLPLRGEVPSGSTITSADDSTMRASILSTHDDGSAAVVVLAGETAVSANATKRLALGIATAGADTALTPTRIGALVASVAVNFSGSYGTATLTDFSTPEVIWWANSRVICARYRLAAPTPGSTALEAVIDITAFPAGQDRALVEVVIENGKINALTANFNSQPAAASYTAATVSVNGTQIAGPISTASVYTGSPAVSTHQPFRAWYCKGWVGGDPGLRATQRHIDLQRHPLFWRMDKDSTVNLGTYTGSTFAPTPTSTYGADAYTPWGNGRFPVSNMGATGDATHIGPLNQWDAHALQTGDYRAWNASEQNALAALSYNINWRHSISGTVPDSSVMVDRQSYNGTWPMTVVGEHTLSPYYCYMEAAHSFSAGLMAFLSRPSPVFIEIAQKLAVWSGTIRTSPLNTFDAAAVGVTDPTGIYRSTSIRGMAWCMRNIVHATFISPDPALNATYSSKLTWRAGGKTWLGRQARYLTAFKLSGRQEGLRIVWTGAGYGGPADENDAESFYSDGTTPWPGKQGGQWGNSFLMPELQKLSAARLLSGADRTTYLEPFVDWYLEGPVRWVNDLAGTGAWRYVRDRWTEVKADNTTFANYADLMAYDVAGGGPAAVDGGWGVNVGSQNFQNWTLTQAAGYESSAAATYASQFWYSLAFAVERNVPGARTAWATVTGIALSGVRGTPGITATNGGTALATWRNGFATEPRWGAWPRNIT